MACFGGATEGIEDAGAASGPSLQSEFVPSAFGNFDLERKFSRYCS